MSKSIKASWKVVTLSLLLLVGIFGLYAAFSGSLEPTAAPGPTMYTLEDMHNYKVWRMLGKTFVDHPGNTRFAIHDPTTPGDNTDDLVLDKETGLIWAREAGSVQMDITTAARAARNFDLGDRKGWRLPSVEELSSLLDMSVAGNPKLPAGHPFVSVQNNYYWTDPTSYASAAALVNNDVYGVNIGTGDVRDYGVWGPANVYAWNVWGGKSVGY